MYKFYFVLLCTLMALTVKAQLIGKSPTKLISLSQGKIEASYINGYLPINQNGAISLWKINGQTGIDVFKIPLIVVFQYTNQPTYFGLNNYFKITYDATRFSKLNKQVTDSLLLTQKNQLTSEKYELLQQKDSLFQLGNDLGNYINSVKINAVKSVTDSLRDLVLLSKLGIDSSQIFRAPGDTAAIGELRNKQAALNDKYNQCTQLIHGKDSLIQSLDDQFKQGVQAKIGKIQTFISGIKAFQLGLLSPDLGAFLLAGVPVQGMYFKYGKKSWSLEIAGGKVMMNPLIQAKNVAVLSNPISQLEHYFDFNGNQYGRRVGAMKFTLGDIQKKYMNIGLLYGQQQQNFTADSTHIGVPFPGSKNLVVTLAAGVTVGKRDRLSFDFGRSATQIQGQSEPFLSQFAEFRKDLRNAMALEWNQAGDIVSLKTRVRLVQPNFNSLGLGFIRKNNVRIEQTVTLNLTTRLSLMASLRHDEDGFFSAFSQHAVFTSGQLKGNYKVNRHIKVFITFIASKLVNDLKEQTTLAPNSLMAQFQSGSMYNNPKGKAIQSGSLIGSVYTSQMNGKQRIWYFSSLMAGGKIGKVISYQANAIFFQQQVSDSLNNLRFSPSVSIKYCGKSPLTLYARYGSVWSEGKWSHGCKGELGYSIRKNLQWTVFAERILISDYFTTYFQLTPNQNATNYGSKILFTF